MQCERRARLAGCNAGAGILGGGYGDAVDGEQQIPGLHPGLLAGAAHIEIGDDHPAMGQAELLRLRVGDVFGHYSDPAADDAAVLDDVVQHAAHHVDGNRKTDALDSEALRDDGGVDADQRAAGIDQGPAGVAEIDRRVGLDEILEGGDPELAAGGSADDAVSHGLGQAEGIADGEDDIADPKLIGSAEGDDRQIRQVDLEYRQVAIRVYADDLRVRDPAVRELHADGAGIRDHVVIRHDVSAPIDDHARAEAALDALPVLRQHVAEDLPER